MVLNSHPNKCLGKMLLCDFSLSSQWLDQLVPHPQPKFPAAACNLFITPLSVPPPTSSPRFPSLGRAFSTPRLCFSPPQKSHSISFSKEILALPVPRAGRRDNQGCSAVGTALSGAARPLFRSLAEAPRVEPQRQSNGTGRCSGAFPGDCLYE